MNLTGFGKSIDSDAATDNHMIISNDADMMACTIETFESGNVGFNGEIDSPVRGQSLCLC
jgi:hypothetical protein